MIPDKIYIPKNLAPHLTEEWASHTHGSLDEYIRKDALLEWANSGLTFRKNGVILDDGFSYAMEELIKKLNSM